MFLADDTILFLALTVQCHTVVTLNNMNEIIHYLNKFTNVTYVCVSIHLLF